MQTTLCAGQDDPINSFSDLHAKDIRVRWASWGQNGNHLQIDVTRVVAKQLETSDRIKVDEKVLDAVAGSPARSSMKALTCVLEIGDRVVRIALIDSEFVFKPGAESFPVADNKAWGKAEVQRRIELLGEGKKGDGLIWARWGNVGRKTGWVDAFKLYNKSVIGTKSIWNKRKDSSIRPPKRSPKKMTRAMIAIDGHPFLCTLKSASYVMFEPSEDRLTPMGELVTAKPESKGSGKNKSAAPNQDPAAATIQDTVVELPGKMGAVRIGGAGRFVVIHVPEEKSLVILDVTENKIVKKILVPSNVAFAANRDKLLIAYPRVNQLQCWDLKTLERENSASLDRTRPPEFALMGSSGDGPLALVSKGGMQLWDPKTMKRMQLDGKLLVGSGRHGFDLKVSANGKTFCGWIPGLSSQPFGVMRIQGNTTKIQSSGAHTQNGRWAMPSADGSLLIDYQSKIYGYDLRPIPVEDFKRQILFPTNDKRFLVVLRRKDNRHLNITVVSAADFQVIHELKDFQSVCDGNYSPNWLWRGGEPCAQYFPEINRAICFPESRDRVVIREFDLKETLKATQKSYLYVVSKPPPSIKTGETFSYQISALSSSNSVNYQLDAGPKGMKVSADGKVVWPVTAQPDDGVAGVIITATTDDGAQALHGFELFVETPDQLAAAADPNKPTAKKKPSKNNVAGSGPNRRGNSDNASEFVATLPGKFVSLRTGKRGRMLIMQFEQSENLAVFDTNQGSIVHNIPAPKNAVYAANRDKLLIVNSANRLLERWDLKSFKREKTAKIPGDVIPTKAVMGADGDGPLALWGNNEIELWDVEKMKPIPKSGPRIGGNKDDQYDMTVSLDGKTFCGWNGRGTRKYRVMRLIGNTTTVQTVPGIDNRQYWAMPNGDGSLLLRVDGKVHSYRLKPIADLPKNVNAYLPTSDPRFLLAVKRQGKKHSRATICTATNFTPIHTIEGLEVPPNSVTSYEPMLRYLVEEKRLIVLPNSRDRVVVKRVNFQKSLATAKAPYLFIHSRPNPAAFADETYTYDIGTWSSSGRQFKMLSAPAGMTLWKDGKIKWPILRRPVGGVANVSVEVSNAEGMKTEHDFEISVYRPTVDLSAEESTPDNPYAGFVSLDNAWLELPQPVDSISKGNRDRMLLVSGNRLVVLGPDGWTIEEAHTLEKSYSKIIEREKHFVAISNAPPSIDVLDKKKLQVVKSLPLGAEKITDVASHPRLPISYVATMNRGSIPRFKFVTFNEETGTGRENDEWLGNWIEVEPNGEFLVAAYSDTYRSGSRLMLNPNRWHVVPEYGSIDWLIRYQIDEDGIPRVSEVKESAGANATGLRMSSDGKRVTYLSHVGYPKYSKNLGGWNSTDFASIPVVYETKDRATSKELAFHPTLPIVASPGSGSAVFFNRETGKLEERFEGDVEKIKNSTVHHIYFSPDGKNLISDVAVNGIRYLRKLPLKLSPEELVKHKSAVNRIGEATTKKALNKFAVPLSALEALGGGIGQDLNTADIARLFSESVVVIKSDRASGTGFVIGKKGYVLTCAHCVGNDTKLQVTLVRPNGNTKSLTGRPVIVDRKMDLALIKISNSPELKPLRLAVGHQVETGVPASVIGNPAVGDQILEHTMTEGIVSSPARDVDGQSHIQTTAAINPGSSGGPLFNNRGLVIGMVVLKARIEDAGFAIPADTICQFLMRHIKLESDSLAIQREWYDDRGKGPVVANLLSYGDNEVKFKRNTDGKEFTVPISKLSAADRRFVELLDSAVQSRKQ